MLKFPAKPGLHFGLPWFGVPLATSLHAAPWSVGTFDLGDPVILRAPIRILVRVQLCKGARNYEALDLPTSNW